MGASKIVDEGEIVRWYEEGRTYRWMCDEYRSKYSIDTVQSMFGNFRMRRGLERRITRDDDLIPWHVMKDHRWAYPLAMLRVEARRRAGRELRSQDLDRLTPWLRDLKDRELVVHYDPDTKEGFFYVPARSIDIDLIREVRPLGHISRASRNDPSPDFLPDHAVTGAGFCVNFGGAAR